MKKNMRHNHLCNLVSLSAFVHASPVPPCLGTHLLSRLLTAFLITWHSSAPHWLIKPRLFTAYATFNSPFLTDYSGRFKLSHHLCLVCFIFSPPSCLLYLAFPTLFTCQIYLLLFFLITALAAGMWAQDSSEEGKRKA